jgi:hypothetical protein
MISASAPAALALAMIAGAAPSSAAVSVPVRSQNGQEQGSFSLRLLEVPVFLAGDPRAQTYIIDHLKPGTTISRRVEVSNHSSSTLHISLYPGAAEIKDGAFIGAAGQTVNELASWTTLSQDTVDVRPGETVRDTVTVVVPRDAAPGERYAEVWASASSAPGGSVTLVNRVGVRMYLSVGGGNPPASKFTVDTLTAERDPTGRAIVHAQVHNTGGRALDMYGNLTLSAASGTLKAGPYPVTLGTTLAPGQSEPVDVVLADQLTDGPWDATIELRSGLLDETYQARITFPHTSGYGKAAAAHLRLTGSHLMELVGGLSASMLLGGAGFIFTRRRRRTGP